MRSVANKQSQTSCTNCPRRELTEWRNLEQKSLDLISQQKHDRVLEPGAILFNQGDKCEGIFCIKDGLVGERRVDADGRSALVRLNRPGTTIGYQELLTKTPYRNSAEILQTSHVCFIANSTVRQLIASSPSVGERFLLRSVEDVVQLESDLVEAKTTGVRERLLHVLLIFYEQDGDYEPSHGYRINIPISRQDLAALIGTSPETISRTIRQIEDRGLARFRGQEAIIANLDAVFEEIALPA
jgi:CRP/FNR family transcriptional regulator